MSEPRKLKIARSSITAPTVIEAQPPAKEVSISAPIVQSAVLTAGDRIEYGVTHEITVDGEKAWVKYGVNSSIGEGETAEQATERLVGFVNAVVVQSATQVATQIAGGLMAREKVYLVIRADHSIRAARKPRLGLDEVAIPIM